jgi:hypothetical protein
LVAAILLYIVYSYNQKCKLRDNESFGVVNKGGVAPADPSAQSYQSFNVAGFENGPSSAPAMAPSAAAAPAPVPNSQPDKPQTDCYPRDRLTADDLLPQGANSKWAEVNPAGQGDIKDQNFLQAGYHYGINTVGSTLRNANLQLRSDPPNPQLNVSPWNQTTIEADGNHRALEIGGDY